MPLQPDSPEAPEATPLATTRNVPIPDPTTLTNQLVSRAIPAMREILESKIEDIDNRLNRLEPMLFERLVTHDGDKQRSLCRKIARLHSEIDGLRLLKRTTSLPCNHAWMARCNNCTLLRREISLLDGQTTRPPLDVRIAMDAAFAAAGAAAQKQELAFTKQIDQLTSNVQLISKASDDKLTDLKDRIVAMESRSSVIRSDHGGGAARPGADDRRLETIQRPGLGRLSAAHRLNHMDFLGHRGGRSPSP